MFAFEEHRSGKKTPGADLTAST